MVHSPFCSAKLHPVRVNRCPLVVNEDFAILGRDEAVTHTSSRAPPAKPPHLQGVNVAALALLSRCSHTTTAQVYCRYLHALMERTTSTCRCTLNRHLALQNFSHPSIASSGLPLKKKTVFLTTRKLAQPILNDRMKAKISIVDCDKKRVTAALLELIAPENLPKRYGGTCPLDMGESEEEVGMREYVASVTPSLAPPPTAAVTPVNTTTLVQGQQSHRVTPAKELVESMPAGESRPMELGGRGESSSLQQRKPAEPERVAVPHDAIPKASPGIVHRRLLSRKKKVGHDVGMAPRDQDEDTSSIVSRSSSHRPPRTRSPARRLLSRIGKGRKSGVRSRSDSDGGRDRARSASPSVAHLGEDDAAVYDGDLQQWVVPGEMGTLGRSGYAASDIGGESRSRRRGWRKWLSRRHGRGKRGLSADRGSSRDVHNLVVSSGSRELDASGSTDSS